MSDGVPTRSMQIVRDSVLATRKATLGVPDGSNGSDPTGDPYKDAVGKAVQSVAQSAAIAVQDGVEMVRNISTVETTAIGVATAKWIAEPENVLYAEIIQNSIQTIESSATALTQIGQAAQKVLASFQ